MDDNKGKRSDGLTLVAFNEEGIQAYDELRKHCGMPELDFDESSVHASVGPRHERSPHIVAVLASDIGPGLKARLSKTKIALKIKDALDSQLSKK